MKKLPHDYVTVDLDYLRPDFIFPDLSSSDGNPMEYFKMASERLFKAGFSLESKELLNMMTKFPYQQQFDIIFRYLDFDNQKIKIDDDGDEYLDIKTNPMAAKCKQIREFQNLNISVLENLLQNSFDFGRENNYSRNIAYYLYDKSAVEWIINKNEEYKWFDLFHIDVFNGSILTNKSIESTFFILNKMADINPELTELFLMGENVFHENVFGKLLKHFDSIFCNTKISPNDISQANYDHLLQTLLILDKINSPKKSEFINILTHVEASNPKLKEKGFAANILKSFLSLSLANTPCQETQPKNKI